MTETDSPSPGPREMRLRYAGRCRECATELPRGTGAIYDPGTKTVCCLACRVSTPEEAGSPGDEATVGGTRPGKTEQATVPTPLPAPAAAPFETAPPIAKPVAVETAPGVAGSSARREHERRVAKREDRIRSKHPRLGGLILALSDEPQSTKAWATGAVGEERLGRRLDATAGPLVRVLHDRGIPRSRANLDHLVVCASGVFVVDAKRYQGRPHHVVEGGFFTPRIDKLLVGRRDCTKLVDAGLKQADLVRRALADDAVDVRSVLCFVEADWPLIGGDFMIRDVTVTWPKKLAATIARPGPLTEEQITDAQQRLATAFPPA